MRAWATLLAMIVAGMVLSQIAAAADLQVRVINDAGLPLANAVVYAVPTTAVVHGKRPTAMIDQIHRRFVPQVSVIQAGTAVDFPNRDNIFHSVYSFSPAKTFQLKLYAGRAAPPVVFNRPGLVVLGCDIHDTMVAWLLVVDTPYFGKSDARGLVTLRNLQPGSYGLHVWHRPMRAAVSSRTLRVTMGTPLSEITLRVDAGSAPGAAATAPMAGMTH